VWLQLIWIEIALKGGIGLILLLAPLTVARVLGLPRSDSGLWPRLLGAALVALAGAYLVEGTLAGRTAGLGPGGSVALNLTAAVMMAAVTFMSSPTMSRRGRIVLWLLAFVVAVLGLAELAVA